MLILLLFLFPAATASADVIYPAPEDLTVGVEVDHLLATLDPGGTVWTDPELMPEGLRLETEEQNYGVEVYLRGVPEVAGTFDLIISYSGSNSICKLRILPAETPSPTLLSVAVETEPLRTQYVAGDTLDPAGLSLRAEWSDGSSTVLSEGYSLYPTRLENAGSQRIEVNLAGKLCFFSVDVEPAPETIEGIGVLTLPTKVVYELGERLEPQGLSIRVYTNNGTRDVMDEELDCSPMELDQAGSQTITVRYGEKTCSFTVQVLEEETAVSMAVFRLPSRMDYTQGDELDPTGLILVVTGSRSSVEYLDEGYTCEPKVLNQPGAQEITVRFGELECRFHVNVKAASVPAATTPPPTAAPTYNPSTPAPTSARVTAPPQIIPTPMPEEQGGGSLFAVIFVAALAALVVLGVYVFAMNRGGSAFFTETFRELFRRRK